jgi:DNA-binding NtrC family response regulator
VTPVPQLFIGRLISFQEAALSNSKSDQTRILLIDSDEAFANILQKVLGDTYVLLHTSSVATAIAQIDAEQVTVVLLNLDLQDDADAHQNSPSLLQAVCETAEPVPVVAYSWDARRDRAVEAWRSGSFDFLEQPLDVQALKFALDRACRRASLLRELEDAQRILRSEHIEGLLGHSKAMDQVNDVVRKVAGVFTTVLITGESGTGKGVVAQAIHRLSPRATKPFVAFSACSFPESLIEDELFGHEKGAFTGASQVRRGRFEDANGGTIFLDEIGDLALPLQTKLLRVLQERKVERLGSNVSHPVDARVICATSRNLEKMVQQGTFREDLYFRISVVKIPMPALRERGEDIPLLAEYFLRMFAKAHNKRARAFTPGFLSALARHHWPGNVRELQNVIERSVVLANGNEHLSVEDLPQELKPFSTTTEIPSGSFHECVQAFKRELVRSALRLHSGNKLKAARELGISRCYLHRLLNQFNLTGSEISDESLGEELEADVAEAELAGERITVASRVA